MRVCAMKQKIKKEVYLGPEQDEGLRKLAEVMGVSEGELIERAIGSYLDGGYRKGKSESKGVPDRRSWLKELEFMKSRLEGRSIGDSYPHRLTREEMYDEIMRERGLYR